jgi:DNA repair exonuclease SbcCD ATPase subunit
VDHEKEFLLLLNRFIDSITSVNQNLGSVRELLNILLQKIETQREDTDRFDEYFRNIEDLLKELSSHIEKNNTVIDVYKGIADNNSSALKDEMLLKVEKLKAETTEKVEEKKSKGIITSERYKLIAAIFAALFTAVSVVLVATINSNSKPDKAKTEHVK